MCFMSGNELCYLCSLMLSRTKIFFLDFLVFKVATKILSLKNLSSTKANCMCMCFVKVS